MSASLFGLSTKQMGRVDSDGPMVMTRCQNFVESLYATPVGAGDGPCPVVNLVEIGSSFCLVTRQKCPVGAVLLGRSERPVTVTSCRRLDAWGQFRCDASRTSADDGVNSLTGGIPCGGYLDTSYLAANSYLVGNRMMELSGQA